MEFSFSIGHAEDCTLKKRSKQHVAGLSHVVCMASADTWHSWSAAGNPGPYYGQGLKAEEGGPMQQVIECALRKGKGGNTCVGAAPNWGQNAEMGIMPISTHNPGLRAWDCSSMRKKCMQFSSRSGGKLAVLCFINLSTKSLHPPQILQKEDWEWVASYLRGWFFTK